MPSGAHVTSISCFLLYAGGAGSWHLPILRVALVPFAALTMPSCRSRHALKKEQEMGIGPNKYQHVAIFQRGHG